MPTALVTSSLERMSDLTVALKSAGFDILAAGSVSAEEVLSRFDVAADLLAQMGPTTMVVLVTDGSDAASRRPAEPLPWWLYAGVDEELDFADWRASVMCLASLQYG